MGKFTTEPLFNMAALSGQQFVENLNSFLTKANLSGAGKAWYSFWPMTNQSDYEFVFNELLPNTGESFLKNVKNAIVIDPGSGYGNSEIPNVIFISNDGGGFASGTAQMAFTNSNQNAIYNGDFAAVQSGWFNNFNGSLIDISGDVTGVYYRNPSGTQYSTTNILGAGGYSIAFTGGKATFVGISEHWDADIYPNSGQVSGFTNPGIFGQFDYTIINPVIGGFDAYFQIVALTNNFEYFEDNLYGRYVVSFPEIFPLASFSLSGLGASGTKEFSVAIPESSGDLYIFFRLSGLRTSTVFTLDNLILKQAIGGDVNTLFTALNRIMPIGSSSGVPLTQNSDFISRSGWYVLPQATGGGSQAFASGGLYKFHNAQLFIGNYTGLVDEASLVISPNSGRYFTTTGNTWLYGQLEITSGCIDLDLAITANVNVGISGSGSIGKEIDVSQTGTQYFGWYIGPTANIRPYLSFNIAPETNGFAMDNFLFWTGQACPELSTGSDATEGVTTTNSSFAIRNGKNKAGLIDLPVGPVTTRSKAIFYFNDAVFSKHYSFSFWHYLKRLDNYYINQLTVLEWPGGFSLKVIDNKYALYHSPTNTTVQTTVPLNDGWSNILVGLIQGNPSSGVIAVNDNVFYGSLGSMIAATVRKTGTFYGTENPSLYEIGFDEIYFWSRSLDLIQIDALYNGGSGAFYPFANTTEGTKYVADILISSHGSNYIIPPTIIIDPPTGGGVRAEAVATMQSMPNRIYAEALPGLSVGGTDFIVTGMQSGSGTLLSNRNDFIRVGNTLDFPDWTVFLNFVPSGKITGVSRVLLSSMESVNQQSGFILGITDSDRLFFEYVDSTNASGSCRRVLTHNEELGKKNLISISKDATYKTLTIAIHDLADHDTRSKTYLINGYNDSNVLYIGGFTNSGNNSAYTGLPGYLCDFLLLSGASTSVQLDVISKAFFTTGYLPSMQVPIAIYYPIVTGASFAAMVVSTGVTGSGLSQISIPDKDGSPITVYDFALQYGNISGTGIIYLSGTSSGVRLSYSGQPEIFYYEDSYIKQYAEENIVFMDYSITNTDIVQIYSFSDKWIDKISVIPQPFNLNDFYILDSFGTGATVLVFNDGLLQVDGINYTLNSGKILSNGYSAYHSTYNFLMYDEITGSIITSGWTGWSGQKTIGGDPTSGSSRDVFLNGQKLISGIDYISSGGTSLVLTGTQNAQTVVWASGIFAFATARTGQRQIYTGTNLGYFKNITSSLTSLMDEMVWLNGQRLAPDFDYKKVASDSLLLSNYRPSGLSFNLYTGDAYFPLSVLTGLPNIS